jgi:hypothetical protein
VAALVRSRRTLQGAELTIVCWPYHFEGNRCEKKLSMWAVNKKNKIGSFNVGFYIRYQ